jgi:hypothetical protein
LSTSQEGAGDHDRTRRLFWILWHAVAEERVKVTMPKSEKDQLATEASIDGSSSDDSQTSGSSQPPK